MAPGANTGEGAGFAENRQGIRCFRYKGVERDAINTVTQEYALIEIELR
ncbi:MAG TPA: hypothetical protein VKB27_02590 [Gammaproteobacteria bacterium]|nr:hypothetical protein [Gammaproteobacteria bacterium]